jgi:hypothetical protein
MTNENDNFIITLVVHIPNGEPILITSNIYQFHQNHITDEHKDVLLL